MLLRYKLSFLHLIFLFLSFQFIGVLNNSLYKGNPIPVYIMGIGIISLIFGILIHFLLINFKSKKTWNYKYFSLFPNHDYLSLLLLFTFVLVGVIYHFSKAGIPLFSPDIEIERFNASKSGLLGIPSRLTLFGTTFLFIFISIYYYYVSNVKRKLKLLFISTNILVITSLLFSGFKSSLLIFLTLLIIINPYLPLDNINRKFYLLKIFLFSLLSLIVVIIIANIYLINRRNASFDLIQIIIDRIFYISGMPFFFVVDEFVPNYGFGFGKYIYLDLKYLLGLLHLIPSVPYNSSKLISAEMWGVDPTSFTVPITINIFGQFYIEFGIYGIIVGSILLGYFISWLYFATFKTRSLFLKIIYIYIQLTTLNVASKGNLVYESMNSIATGILLLIFILLVKIILYPSFKDIKLFKFKVFNFKT